MAGNMKPPLGVESSAASAVSMRHVLVGLLVAPCAWLAQMIIAETLAAQSCYPLDQPLASPALPWMRPSLVVISALCLAAGAFGALTAWRNVRRLEAAKEGASGGVGQRRSGLDAFLTRIAMMCSGLFLFALIATDIALALVSPCKWW
ncbi:hypothetical protein [Paraburkholderia phytofirmans]|uniref:Transmembrane protein n=2 Tax=Paraburkholderia phytofirmans TaxID=261302 RepID=B2T4C5_PARPJ|nr:hypothetical protein [Paraburkholderia phytofirmans]ACD16436.1 conserved hypothetical protein [Paraburkholderia phytofirmans PsJN]